MNTTLLTAFYHPSKDVNNAQQSACKETKMKKGHFTFTYV